MTTDEQPTLKIVSVNFEDYELVLGVADSHNRALRIAARYRQSSKKKGWRFCKRGAIGSLRYLEYRADGIGISTFTTFEIEDCTLNRGIYDDE